MDDRRHIFRQYTFHRIHLLLRGIVDKERFDPHSDISRQHYWIFPEQYYHREDRVNFPHKGVLSLQVFREQTESPYEYRNNAIYYRGQRTHLLAFLHDEPKEMIYRREGGGGILCFDMNNTCAFHCKYCARLKRSPSHMNWLARYSEKDAIETALEKYCLSSLETLAQISLVTGCFGSEDDMLNHLLALLSEAEKKKFRGDFYLASHEIRSERALKKLRAAVKGDVYYALTVESFSQRSSLMPGAKDLPYPLLLSRIRKILGRAYYNYILGLDDYQTFQENVTRLAPQAIPYLSIFAIHVKEQEGLYAPDARDIQYYLQAYDFVQRRFGTRIYMHKAPFYNVSNRALCPYPETVFS